MLYFRFNDDKFVGPRQELGNIGGYFFNKLRNELNLSEVGIVGALNDVFEVPVGAFDIDDEVIGNLDGVLKFALSEYAKLPIEKLGNKSLHDLGIEIGRL